MKSKQIVLSNTKLIKFTITVLQHLAMISGCLVHYSTNNYLDFNHPHQQKIRNVFENFSNTKF